MRRFIFNILFFPYYKIIFGSFGIGSKIHSPMLSGARRIFIGKKVFIRRHVWLAANPLSQSDKCKLTIGDDTYIGNFCHIYTCTKIEIGKKVLIADRVYLSDNTHNYQDVNTPIIDQPVSFLKPVILKDGCWIGENASVIGATVGRNSVVGAHSLVLSDIPDFCVAVGVPAKIIKRFDTVTGSWIRVNDNVSV